MNVPKCLSKISPIWAKILDEYSISDIVEGIFVSPTNDNPNIERFNNSDENEQYRQSDVLENQLLDINAFECCIVGEAFNLNPDNKWNDSPDNPEKRYNGCRTCVEHSLSFCDMLEALDNPHDDNISIEDYEEHIELFCEHIGSKHPELIKNSDEVCEK